MNEKLPSIGTILDYPELIHSNNFSAEERAYMHDLLSVFYKLRRDAQTTIAFDSISESPTYFRKLNIPGVNC